MKLFIIFILLLELNSEKYLILNIKTDNTKLNQIIYNNFIKSEDIIEALFYNNIFYLTKIGKPKRELKLYLSFNTSKTIINNKEYSNFHSATYKYNNITNDSIDLFEVNRNEINDYYFNLLDIAENNKNINNKCILGLRPSNESNKKANFLFQLKKNGFIDERIFSIIIKENPENEYLKKEFLLLGRLPEEYDSKNFPKNKINWSPICQISKNDKKNDEKWIIKIDSFNLKEDNNYLYNADNTYFEFILENNLIIGPDTFRDYLLDNFLNSLIYKEICKEDYFYNERNQKHFIYYECRKFEEFKNKILYFKNKELNETFEINLADLFYEYKRKFFFGIIFDGNPKKNKGLNNIWGMGKIFYEKYSFVFDDENKRIGYYKIEKLKENPFIILVSFFSFLCFIFLMIIIGINIKKKNINKDINEKGKSKENKENKVQKEKIN